MLRFRSRECRDLGFLEFRAFGTDCMKAEHFEASNACFEHEAMAFLQLPGQESLPVA